uniref:Phlebovirus_G2 domain-containing protein n=1 Tax=Haemonchus contortus TaxID=6289 RepID=A0A7I4Y7E5_HAECO
MQRQRTHHSRWLLEALAVFGLIATAWACQTVNVFSHELKNCITKSGRTVCSIETASVLKVNSFKREACIRLQNNNATAMEIRIDWIGLRLLCQKRTVMYTRNVVQKVIDSKRCARMGSCVENKCADINSTSMLEELSIGNSFPGSTYCIESCGGLGCGCLTPSSGCLLYRIYAVPADEETYEIFDCVKWQEEVKLKVRLRRQKEHKFRSYVIGLKPNVPITLPSMKTTLSVLSWQYFNLLEARFVRRGNTTALWTSSKLPLLQCSSKEEADSLKCSLIHTCECTPAESQVMCRCENQDIAEEFHQIGNVLPVTYPFVKMTNHPHYNVIARIEHGVTAELVLNVNETVGNIVTDTTDEICYIANTHIYGCYSCKEGARVR